MVTDREQPWLTRSPYPRSGDGGSPVLGGRELRLQRDPGALAEVVDVLPTDAVVSGEIGDNAVLPLRGESDRDQLGRRGGMQRVPGLGHGGLLRCSVVF